MTAPRRRASESPDQARWAQVWLAADQRQPFKVEHAAPMMPARRRWFGLLR